MRVPLYSYGSPHRAMFRVITSRETGKVIAARIIAMDKAVVIKVRAINTAMDMVMVMVISSHD